VLLRSRMPLKSWNGTGRQMVIRFQWTDSSRRGNIAFWDT
jgi:hypothetical protein